MPKQKKMWDNILTVIMSVLCLLWIYPIVLILLNSLKRGHLYHLHGVPAAQRRRPLWACPTTFTA